MMNTIHKQNTEKKKLSLCIQIYILNSKFLTFKNFQDLFS